MEKIINFSGLGFEIGQMKRGLTCSPVSARNYFSILNNAGITLLDRGDVLQDETISKVKFFSESDLKNIHWNKYQQAFLKTLSLLEENIPLINWGGDHSVAMASVGAFSHCYKDGYVIWIDAHADLNLPSQSLSGNLHGMPMAVLLNLENIAGYHFKWIKQYLDPKKIIYIGLRDLDPFEQGIINSLGIKAFTYTDVEKIGINSVVEEILTIVNDQPLHISFDIDSVDPTYAPSTGVPVERGLSPVDLEYLARMFYQKLNIRSVDIVEINPMIGTSLEVDQTYITAFHFLKSLFTHNTNGDLYENMGTRSQTKCFNEMEWSL